MTDEELALDQEEQTDADGPEEEASPDEQFMAKLKEAVVVEQEDLGGLRLKLSITVPREILDDRLHEQFDELRREALVPGFRKGHAPIKLVEKRFGADVGEELKGKFIGSAFMAATEKLEVKPLGDPLIWVKTKEDRVGEDGKSRTVEVEKLMAFDAALDHLNLPKDDALSFTCEMELSPEFELPELDGIPLKRPTLTVEEADVDAEIDRVQSWAGTFAPVEDGPVEANDLLYTNMKLTVDGDVIATEEGFDVPARDGRIRGIPTVGLKDALVGRKPGDTVAINAEVPEDHEEIALRGKTATFEFVIEEIKRLVRRELDPEFLESLGFESEEDLRESLRQRMERELGQAVEEKLKEQAAEYLVENTRLEIPTGLSHRQTERSVARRMIELYQSGMPQTEIEQKLDELRASAREQVVRDLKLYFILDKIAGEHEIEVQDEEMNAAVARIAARTGKRFDRVRDELAKGDGLFTLHMRLRDDKVLEQLVQNAKVSEVEGPKKRKGKSAAGKKDAP